MMKFFVIRLEWIVWNSVFNWKLDIEPSVFLSLFEVDLSESDIVFDDDVFFNHQIQVVWSTKLWKPFLEQFFQESP